MDLLERWNLLAKEGVEPPAPRYVLGPIEMGNTLAQAGAGQVPLRVRRLGRGAHPLPGSRGDGLAAVVSRPTRTPRTRHAGGGPGDSRSRRLRRSR